MREKIVRLSAVLIVLTLVIGRSTFATQVDLIVGGAKVWTGTSEQPWAEAVAVTGDRIAAVGSFSDLLELSNPETRVIRLEGGLVVPGLIDNHTHFDRAGELLLGINLLDVSDEDSLQARIGEAIGRLPEGAWVLGGDWGAYEAWEMSSSGDRADSPAAERFDPDRKSIDPVSEQNPVLLSRWDRKAYVANRIALERAEVDCSSDGVECGPDGRPTGRLTAEAAEQIRQSVPPKSINQHLAESRAALKRLRSHGVTGIHDITGADQMKIFQLLERRDELTVRVYARPTLDQWPHLAALGIRHGYGSEYLKMGGLKGFVDGIMGNSSARFYEPYLTTGERGSWREMMRPPGNLDRLLAGADKAGHWPQIHAIGDEAIDRLLDSYESLIAGDPAKERRLRIIHAQVLRSEESAARMAEMGVIAEVQPYHCIDDMRWMEERIGTRSRWAYAFKTMQEAGVRLSFGSDWPGTNASWYPASPVLGIYAAVTRQTLDGLPEQGWFPEERIDIETALEAYTVNNAWAAGEESLKGSLEVGKLADIVVLDKDILAIDPATIKETNVLFTILGGRVVYDKASSVE